MPLVFAATAPLHMRRNHIDRRRRLDPLINGHQQEGLGATPRSAAATHSRGIDIGQFFEQVHDPDAVPQLQTQCADAPQVFSPAPVRAVSELIAVVVACHIVSEGHDALPREIDTAAGDRIRRRVF